MGNECLWKDNKYFQNFRFFVSVIGLVIIVVLSLAFLLPETKVKYTEDAIISHIHIYHNVDISAYFYCILQEFLGFLFY